MKLEFEAELWEYQGEDPWVFVTVPEDLATEIRESGAQRSPFGSIKTSVGVGNSRWETSLFPDRESGSFVLPIKKEIRRAQGLSVGDTARVTIELAP